MAAGDQFWRKSETPEESRPFLLYSLTFTNRNSSKHTTAPRGYVSEWIGTCISCHLDGFVHVYAGLVHTLYPDSRSCVHVYVLVTHTLFHIVDIHISPSPSSFCLPVRSLLYWARDASGVLLFFLTPFKHSAMSVGTASCGLY